jgi:hypothetical protein
VAYEQNQEGRDETPNHPGNHIRYRAADPTAGAEPASGDRSKRPIRGDLGIRRISGSSVGSITSDNICHIKSLPREGFGVANLRLRVRDCRQIPAQAFSTGGDPVRRCFSEEFSFAADLSRLTIVHDQPVAFQHRRISRVFIEVAQRWIFETGAVE